MSTKLYEKMNMYLANQEISYIKLHNMHWYVKGHNFFTLHAKLEELYHRSAVIIDEVAERLMALGQSPVAHMKKALSLATIKELTDAPISSDDALHGLKADVKQLIDGAKEIADMANEGEDGVTADQFYGYLGEHQKLLWMLDSCLAS